ncbi:MAG: hypothetical protein RJA25_1835 [Bacteroidota bacterium]|jgi:hypothetical protein
MRFCWSILLLTSFLVACNKWETNPPLVQIGAPLTNDTLQLNDSIHIQATITDKHLSSYKIILYNYYSHAILYKETGNANVNPFTLDKKISFILNADTTVYMNILGVDKNGNTGSAGISFFIRNE